MIVKVEARHMDVAHPCPVCCLRAAIAEALEVMPDELIIGMTYAISNRNKASEEGRFAPEDVARIGSRDTALYHAWIGSGMVEPFELELRDTYKLI